MNFRLFLLFTISFCFIIDFVCILLLSFFNVRNLCNEAKEIIKETGLKSFVNQRKISSYVIEFPHGSFFPSKEATKTEISHSKSFRYSSTSLDAPLQSVSWSDLEGLQSLEAAIEMSKLGKTEKAQKLFEHALALAPRHPDVLNHYGEFLEKAKNDVINADHLYLKALANSKISSPGHLRAINNHNRVIEAVSQIDIQILKRIDEKRDVVASIPEASAALRKAKLEAYFQHIYHTVGIEGNTMTLSQTRAVVETRMAVAGKSVTEHNEILGLDAALKFINTTLVNRIGQLTIDDILGIHKRVMGYVDPVEAGTFRRTQVFVGGHVPPGPSSIPPLMRRFETWLNSWEALQLHPVEYAAYAHYKLVYLHPFNDGNGRTARLLMNTILMQAGFPPVIIMKQDRHRYYKTLELANEGDIRPFVRFIAECTEQTLDLFIWSTTEFSTELPALAGIMTKDESLL